MIRHFTGSLWIAAVASSEQRHLEAAVADDRPDLLVSGCANCAPIAAGKPKPIVPAPPLEQPVAVAARQAELRGPHLVLADVGGEDRVALA